METFDPGSVWTLRADLAWAHVLLRLVSIPGVTPMKPEVHYFLFDRYFRLSELHHRRGSRDLADHLRLVAVWHYERSGFDTTPPAAAAARPIPRPSLTWAVAGRPKPGDRWRR